MTRKSTQKIEIGETVYARWHGDNEFIVTGKVSGQKVPHFICRLQSLYAIEQSWIFPLIHLSTRSLTKATNSSNRKQLSLF
jgi:hypothetical protein